MKTSIVSSVLFATVSDLVLSASAQVFSSSLTTITATAVESSYSSAVAPFNVTTISFNSTVFANATETGSSSNTTVESFPVSNFTSTFWESSSAPTTFPNVTSNVLSARSAKSSSANFTHLFGSVTTATIFNNVTSTFLGSVSATATSNATTTVTITLGSCVPSSTIRANGTGTADNLNSSGKNSALSNAVGAGAAVSAFIGVIAALL
ncbi:hypothetical protein BDQ17DRAFT_1342818 [Cyathus striatus]|nr:hypothetical protein BDQ17DRAFT_1342818 [Cyathus striatus]